MSSIFDGLKRITLVLRDEGAVMPWGKWKGRSVSWLIRHEPAYVIWLWGLDNVQVPEDILRAACREQNVIDSQTKPHRHADYDDDECDLGSDLYW